MKATSSSRKFQYSKRIDKNLNDQSYHSNSPNLTDKLKNMNQMSVKSPDAKFRILSQDSSPNKNLTKLQERIATATSKALKSVKLFESRRDICDVDEDVEAESRNLRIECFGVSPIYSEESSSHESLDISHDQIPPEKIEKKPTTKRDIDSFLQGSMKYGLKITKILSESGVASPRKLKQTAQPTQVNQKHSSKSQKEFNFIKKEKLQLISSSKQLNSFESIQFKKHSKQESLAVPKTNSTSNLGTLTSREIMMSSINKFGNINLDEINNLFVQTKHKSSPKKIDIEFRNQAKRRVTASTRNILDQDSKGHYNNYRSKTAVYK